MNLCISCGKETDNPKFCSRSCAASYNNKIFPKKKTQKVCTKCGQPVENYRNSLCPTHKKEHKESNRKDKTIGEYRNMKSVAGKHPSWTHAHIRALARTWLKHLTSKPCAHCGYEKHVELAHIKALSEFSDDTLLSVVNSEANVIQLCPNCHWEFDNLPR